MREGGVTALTTEGEIQPHNLISALASLLLRSVLLQEGFFFFLQPDCYRNKLH